MANLGSRPSSFLLLNMFLTTNLLTQSLVREERSNVYSYRNRTTTFCLPPKLNTPGAILKWRKDRNNSIFLPGEKAEYVCEEDHRQIGLLKAVICQHNGTWKHSSADNGYCLTNICNGSKTFNCTDGSTAIDVCHMCDCVADCPDASDEMSCDTTLINVTGQATGFIKYPVPSPHKSVKYAGLMECKRTLWTDDPGFYIKLWFTNFSLPPNCERNHVSLENVTFTDPERSPVCCEQTENVRCCVGEHAGQPPLSRSTTNWMTVVLATEKSNSSTYTAKWFNVNGFFPNGVIPRKDPSYPKVFTIINTTPKSAYDRSLGVNSTLAIVLFALIVFVVGSTSACMLGKRWIGPSFSFASCWTRISFRIPRRRRRPELSLDDPVEASPLMLNSDSPLVEQRVTQPRADNGSLSSLPNEDSVNGSTDNVA